MYTTYLTVEYKSISPLSCSSVFSIFSMASLAVAFLLIITSMKLATSRTLNQDFKNALQKMRIRQRTLVFGALTGLVPLSTSDDVEKTLGDILEETIGNIFAEKRHKPSGKVRLV